MAVPTYDKKKQHIFTGKHIWKSRCNKARSIIFKQKKEKNT